MNEPVPSLAVTTSGKPDDAAPRRARALAARLDLPFIERPWKSALAKMFDQAGAFLVVANDALRLCDPAGSLVYSPGMAWLRIKRLDQGHSDDMLLRTSALSPGESVLDCTLGLGADALVAARLVGPTGRVVGLEKSRALYALVSEGMAAQGALQRSARVEVHHADALEYLQRLPTGAFDCVLFDPMFETPRRASPAFDTLRRFADYSPLTPRALDEACRVARRLVIVKGARYSTDLKKLRLVGQASSKTATVVWAAVPASRAALITS